MEIIWVITNEQKNNANSFEMSYRIKTQLHNVSSSAHKNEEYTMWVYCLEAALKTIQRKSTRKSFIKVCENNKRPVAFTEICFTGSINRKPMVIAW